MRTLCVDVGGTGIKAITVDETGQAVTERARIETPKPATPEAVTAVMVELAQQQGAFDRISVGFPGVVVDGVTKTAPNLGEGWAGYPLAMELQRLSGRPVRVANDAGVQGLAVIEGRGTEIVVTLGTGMGFGLYVDGHYVPNVEMAHHPFRKGKTYEERVGDKERKRIGRGKWEKRVHQVIAQLEPIFNYRVLYLGGGNSARLDPALLPDNVRVVSNVAGLLGGIRLWQG